MSQLKPHQQRMLDFLRALQPEVELQTEVAVPQSSLFIDVLITRLDAPSVGWGPLQGRLRARLLLLEHFSEAPPLEDLLGAIVELMWATQGWVQQEVGGRPPLMLILTAGDPRSAREALGELTGTAEPGIYRMVLPMGAELILCVVTALREDLDTAVLRLFNHRRAGYRRAVADLVSAADVGVVSSQLVEHIWEVVMSQGEHFSPEDRELTLQQFREKYVGLGQEKGREEGREEGRQALLAIARLRASAEEMARLEAIDDLGALEQQVLVLMRDEEG